MFAFVFAAAAATAEAFSAAGPAPDADPSFSAAVCCCFAASGSAFLVFHKRQDRFAQPLPPPPAWHASFRVGIFGRHLGRLGSSQVRAGRQRRPLLPSGASVPSPSARRLRLPRQLRRRPAEHDLPAALTLPVHERPAAPTAPVQERPAFPIPAPHERAPAPTLCPAPAKQPRHLLMEVVTPLLVHTTQFRVPLPHATQGPTTTVVTQARVPLATPEPTQPAAAPIPLPTAFVVLTTPLPQLRTPLPVVVPQLRTPLPVAVPQLRTPLPVVVAQLRMAFPVVVAQLRALPAQLRLQAGIGSEHLGREHLGSVGGLQLHDRFGSAHLGSEQLGRLHFGSEQEQLLYSAAQEGAGHFGSEHFGTLQLTALLRQQDRSGLPAVFSPGDAAACCWT